MQKQQQAQCVGVEMLYDELTHVWVAFQSDAAGGFTEKIRMKSIHGQALQFTEK
ncbi:MAG: hypothetical protein JKY37_24800 [Nannocystaceae bacterium]|nr:hypothetical protein [Nannocystaceae bacterium]